MSEERTNMELVIKRDELRGMCIARAEAHTRRARVYEARLKRYSALTGNRAEEAMKLVAETSDETLDDAQGAPMPFANSDAHRLQDAMLSNQDGMRAHSSAATWLRFMSEHLPPLAEIRFTGSGIDFVGYLVDVSHPHAMPNVGWSRETMFGVRGVQ